MIPSQKYMIFVVHQNLLSPWIYCLLLCRKKEKIPVRKTRPRQLASAVAHLPQSFHSKLSLPSSSQSALPPLATTTKASFLTNWTHLKGTKWEVSNKHMGRQQTLLKARSVNSFSSYFPFHPWVTVFGLGMPTPSTFGRMSLRKPTP